MMLVNSDDQQIKNSSLDHEPIMVLMSAHHMVTSSVSRKLKSLSTENIFQ